MTYQERRRLLIDYLRMKLDEDDLHAVADAAMDLRELDAEERGRTMDRLEGLSADMVALEGSMGGTPVTFENLHKLSQIRAACQHDFRYDARLNETVCVKCRETQSKYAAPV